MVGICCYFQVHQPFRLRRDFDFFAIGTDKPYEDEAANAAIMRKISEKCYLPANQLMLDLIKRYEGNFKIAFSISGVALDQFELYAPEVLASFQELAATGCVEFLSETYYHSLAFLFSQDEFRRQVRMHQQKIRALFGVSPKVFRNTELIYDNHLAQVVESLGFTGILAEGADRLLGWRSPNFVYRPQGCKRLALLLKNYRLSDDVAFRFSNRSWDGWPLTADKYAGWLHQHAVSSETVNLFMDYETFGEHQWESTGIFGFLRHLPEAVMAEPGVTFMTPSEVARIPAVGTIDAPDPVSWADQERDVSAWLGNHMQDAAVQQIYGMEKEVLASRDEELIHAWRKLQTSDHFYYMCTKWHQDGDVHTYFSPYDSPYDAFIYYTNALSQLKWDLGHRRHEQKEAARHARAAAKELLVGRREPRAGAKPRTNGAAPRAGRAKRRPAPAVVQQ